MITFFLLVMLLLVLCFIDGLRMLFGRRRPDPTVVLILGTREGGRDGNENS